MFSASNNSGEKASERKILEFDMDLYEVEVDFGEAQVHVLGV